MLPHDPSVDAHDDLIARNTFDVYAPTYNTQPTGKPCGDHAQGSDEWKESREGKLTGTKLGTLLGLNRYNNYLPLICDLTQTHHLFDNSDDVCPPISAFGQSAMAHGSKYEDTAVQLYETIYNKKVNTYGLLADPENEVLAASPDGITTDGILVEIKCPYVRYMSCGNIMGKVRDYHTADGRHVKYVTRGNNVIRSYYYAQIQLNMHINKLTECHFIEYQPASLFKMDYDTIHRTIIKYDPLWWQCALQCVKVIFALIDEHKSTLVSRNRVLSLTQRIIACMENQLAKQSLRDLFYNIHSTAIENYFFVQHQLVSDIMSSSQ